MNNDTLNAISGGAYLARFLKSQQISYVFFVDAILRHALSHMELLGIVRVLAHSEKGAAYMADGFARASRRPAVCMAQSVGAFNLAAGLQDAHFAHSPVIAITGRHIAANQYRNAYQELPHEPLFAEVTKLSARIEVAGQLGPLLQRAFHVSASGQTGPAHLDVASNVGMVTDFWQLDEPHVPAPRVELPVTRPAPEARQISTLTRAIAASRAPVLVVGDGVCWSSAEKAVRAFARQADMPVLCSLDAKAVMAGEDRYDMGVTGTYGTDAANRLLSEADFVLFVGCDMGDQLTSNWKLPQRGVQVAHVGVKPEELGLNLGHETIQIQADPRNGLEALIAGLPVSRHDAWIARGHALRAQWWDQHAEQLQSSASPLRPERLCAELTTWLPDDVVMVADTGYASQWSSQFIKLTNPNQRFLRAAGSLGWAFPAALGAKAATPERPVVCLTGDGGFMYHLPELETARRRKLHTITIVNNNGVLAQGLKNLRVSQVEGSRNMEDCFKFIQQDFAAIAEVFGCVGLRAASAGQLRECLSQALDAKAPVVIDVLTDPEALAPIPWMPS